MRTLFAADFYRTQRRLKLKTSLTPSETVSKTHTSEARPLGKTLCPPALFAEPHGNTHLPALRRQKQILHQINWKLKGFSENR